MLSPEWSGRRVSVRVAVPGPDGDGPTRTPRYADVVGDLIGLDEDRAVVDARRGPVEIPLRAVAAARLAPPSTADELALERIAAAGWRAAETAQVGGWLLRANSGLTGRANSVLPLAAPGMRLDDALAAARAWYAARGLPLRLQLPTEARRLLDAELGERGWPASPDVSVMAARLDLAGQHAVDHGGVHLDAEPDETWLAVYRGGGADQRLLRALLTRHDQVVFASVRDGGGPLAIGRAALDDGWLGLSGVEVVESARRRGLARAVISALWQWGRERGATRGYLQVARSNCPAIALYRRMGYWTHHDYRYRTDPEVIAPDETTAAENPEIVPTSSTP